MDKIIGFKTTPFVEYNHIILDQITSGLLYNDIKISNFTGDIDIFKNFIFKSVIRDNRLYIYNLYDDIFYEIEFKFSVLSYMMIQNHLLLTLYNKETTFKLIVHLDEGKLFVMKDKKKIQSLNYMINIEETLKLISNKDNYIEVSKSEIEELKADESNLKDNIIDLKKKKYNDRSFEIIDFKTGKVFTISYHKIIDLIKGKTYAYNSKILECLNMSDDYLLIILLNKNKNIKYHIFSKVEGTYIKEKNIKLVIDYIQSYYDILRSSIYVKDNKNKISFEDQ